MKRTPKPKAAEPVVTAPMPAEPVVHSGPAHDWRNPDAVFTADDHCIEARLARLARR